MSFTIKSKNDVFKFALPLHDYLSQHGKYEEAEALASLVDSCYPQNAQALEAHGKAFKQIRETITDLPPEYQQALDDALSVLSGEK
ncbi:MAG: adenylate cyclase [Desulfitobacterium sp.]